MQIDEAAMKVITNKLIDPWHRTFARDVVEMYLKHSNKHSDAIKSASSLYWSPESNKPIEDILGIPSQQPIDCGKE